MKERAAVLPGLVRAMEEEATRPYSRVVDSVLKEEARKLRLKKLEEKLREMRSVLDKIDVGEFAELIREDRESR